MSQSNSQQSQYRNNWVLCKSHKECPKCKKALGDWRNKAKKMGYKASALKFVLDCILNEESVSYRYDEELHTIPKMPDVNTDGKPIKYTCGICTEKMTMGGNTTVQCRKPLKITKADKSTPRLIMAWNKATPRLMTGNISKGKTTFLT